MYHLLYNFSEVETFCHWLNLSVNFGSKARKNIASLISNWQRHWLIVGFNDYRNSQPYRNPTLPHPLFRLLHGVLTVMKDARSQHGVCAALLHAVGQVVEVAHAA